MKNQIDIIENFHKKIVLKTLNKNPKLINRKKEINEPQKPYANQKVDNQKVDNQKVLSKITKGKVLTKGKVI